MADTYTITYAINAAGVTNSGASSVTGGGQAILNEDLTIATKRLFDIAFPYATIKSVFMLSSVAATIYTNSNSAEDDLIALPAGKPIVWDTASLADNPFTADVTKFYVTSAATGTLKVYVLYDSTPA